MNENKYFLNELKNFIILYGSKIVSNENHLTNLELLLNSIFTKKEENWEFNEKIDGQILEIYPLLIKFMAKNATI